MSAMERSSFVGMCAFFPVMCVFIHPCFHHHRYICTLCRSAENNECFLAAAAPGRRAGGRRVQSRRWEPGPAATAEPRLPVLRRPEGAHAGQRAHPPAAALAARNDAARRSASSSERSSCSGCSRRRRPRPSRRRTRRSSATGGRPRPPRRRQGWWRRRWWWWRRRRRRRRR